MKRVFCCVLGIVLLCLSLCSCQTKRSLLAHDYYQEEALLNNIMQAIETNDSDALLSVFSKQAITESPQIEAEIKQFLKDFPNGKFTWENQAGGSRDYEHGDVVIEKIHSKYEISLSDNTYILLLIRWNTNDDVTDSELQDKIGVYTMRMIDSADYQEQFDSLYAASLEIPGVYYKPSRLYSE